MAATYSKHKLIILAIIQRMSEFHFVAEQSGLTSLIIVTLSVNCKHQAVQASDPALKI